MKAPVFPSKTNELHVTYRSEKHSCDSMVLKYGGKVLLGEISMFPSDIIDI